MSRPPSHGASICFGHLSSLCPAGTIGSKLEQFATAKLQRALDLMNEAELATKPKRQQRLLDKASKVLGKILHHKPGTTTDECLDILGAEIDGILGTLSGQPAEDPTFTIGGTVTGLEGTGLVLHEASNEDVTPGNGAFTFPVAVPGGSPYAVTVAVKPVRSVCTVTSGSGTITDADGELHHTATSRGWTPPSATPARSGTPRSRKSKPSRCSPTARSSSPEAPTGISPSRDTTRTAPSTRASAVAARSRRISVASTRDSMSRSSPTARS